uniref:Uncharacterized protein n=1 Tax=Oryza nivara TaxID=4536 RepID=A0A0E0ICQ6_ORYNI
MIPSRYQVSNDSTHVSGDTCKYHAISTTYCVILARYHVKPVRYQTISITYRVILTRYHAIPVMYQTISTTYRVILARYHVILVKYQTISTMYRAILARYRMIPTKYQLGIPLGRSTSTRTVGPLQPSLVDEDGDDGGRGQARQRRW